VELLERICSTFGRRRLLAGLDQVLWSTVARPPTWTGSVTASLVAITLVVCSAAA
jgi:hypothetical protein